MPYVTTKEENQEVGGAEEEQEGDADEEQDGGETQGAEAVSEGGNENSNENGRNGGRGRKDRAPPLRFQTYKEAVKKYSLLLMDNDLVGRFKNEDKKCFTPDNKSS